jgi:hypothetical protein
MVRFLISPAGHARHEPMNIPEAHDLKGALRDATELAGSHHTVVRYMANHERSQAGCRAAGMTGEFMPELEELIKRSQGEYPRRRGTREDHRDGACRGRAHHVASPTEGGLRVRSDQVRSRMPASCAVNESAMK